ncbi:hypothetical protein CTL2C_701 [Chlamydia trachomatis L2c]|nr:hypothetical protein CTL2C_701 [Chlamydia trachomatis L2c]
MRGFRVSRGSRGCEIEGVFPIDSNQGKEVFLLFLGSFFSPPSLLWFST